MLNGFVHAINIVNALFASLIFLIMVYKGQAYFKSMDNARRAGYIAFMLYVLAATFYSGYRYNHPAHLSLPTLFFFAANATTFYALWKHSQLFVSDAELVKHLKAETDDDHEDEEDNKLR